jgi:glutamyl-tRNA(Gln) amidotransferase subunit E
VKLPKFRKLLNWELSGSRTFADELAGRVRVIACIDHMPNLFHTDGPGGGLDVEDRERFAKAAELGDEDVAVIVYGDEEDTKTAVEEILIRVHEAASGLPNETRQSLPNNSTDFERILPGPDRMYPDTDSPPYEVTDERIAAAQALVPELPWIREERYREMGLPEDVLWQLAISPFAPLFDKLVSEDAVAPMRAGEVLTRMLVAARRDGARVKNLTVGHMETLLRALGDGAVQREILPRILFLWANSPEQEFSAIVDRARATDGRKADVTDVVKQAVDRARRESRSQNGALPRIAMGIAMQTLAGYIPGAQVAKAVEDALA